MADELNKKPKPVSTSEPKPNPAQPKQVSSPNPDQAQKPKISSPAPKADPVREKIEQAGFGPKEYKAKYKPKDVGNVRYYPNETGSMMDKNNKWIGKSYSIHDAFGFPNDSKRDWVGKTKSGADIARLPDGYFSTNPRITSMSFKTIDDVNDYEDFWRENYQKPQEDPNYDIEEEYIKSKNVPSNPGPDDELRQWGENNRVYVDGGKGHWYVHDIEVTKNEDGTYSTEPMRPGNWYDGRHDKFNNFEDLKKMLDERTEAERKGRANEKLGPEAEAEQRSKASELYGTDLNKGSEPANNDSGLALPETWNHQDEINSPVVTKELVDFVRSYLSQDPEISQNYINKVLNHDIYDQNIANFYKNKMKQEWLKKHGGNK